ncbi:MAG TPA: HEAT repeat domain-containing protein [Verrucomicrobiae bacterium]
MSDSSSKDLLPAKASQLSSDALAALRAYDTGSGRAALCPLDDAVRDALPDPSARAKIEASLLAVLQQKPTPAAVEYICSKLALVGSDACVSALAALLGDPINSTPARNALEKLPGESASTALVKSLVKLNRAEKAGAIRSLGARADAASVGALTEILKDPDREIAAAAAGALGAIGSAKSAKALKQCLAKGAEVLRPFVADAMLACAERLLATGHRPDAKSLYESLAKSDQLPHVREAASRGLEGCASARSQIPGT